MKKNSKSLYNYCVENDASYILEEWDCEKNEGLTPKNIAYSSNKDVWWKCSSNHSYSQKVYSRTRAIKEGRLSKCVYCSNSRVLPGFNDLKTKFPEIADEWHPIKNGDLKPENFTHGSEQEVWWKCEHEHEWKISINYRTSKNSKCPECNNKAIASFPEMASYFYLKQIFTDAKFRFKHIKNVEIDVYIPSIKIGIEYDGYKWHKDRTEYDIYKNRAVKEDGIIIIRIREKGLELIDSENCISIERTDNSSYKSLDDAIKNILKTLVKMNLIKKEEINININTREDRNKINSLIKQNKKERSVASHSNLIKEWDYEKNEGLNPEYVSIGSKSLVWWKCKNGHTWEMAPASRSGKDYGCHYCSNKKVWKGFNDLPTTNPEIFKLWNFEKNSIDPYTITSGCDENVWWKCEKGHEWDAKVYTLKAGSRCPVCANKKLLKGFNDLASQRPDLVKEWDYEMNNNIKPEDVIMGSHIEIYWKCKHNHTWKARVSDRSKRNGTGCPVCVNRVLWKGFNDLASQRPDLIKEWDYKKNNKNPDEVLYVSTEKVWWKCEKGHEWDAKITDRTKKKGTNCPYCANQKVWKGFNDLASQRPDLIKEWSFKKNSKNPNEVYFKSTEKVWWECEKGHEWEVSIRERSKENGTNCPYCANLKVWKGFNDLESNYPNIASLWNYKKNTDLKPDNIYYKSGSDVWWICKSCKGEYQRKVNNQVCKATKCPLCRDEIVK